MGYLPLLLDRLREAVATRGDLARLLLAALLFALVLGVYGALLTYGSGDLIHAELLGAAYDSLAASLLQGRAEVDPAAIAWEPFIVEGRTYMYFGPFPALLRIPLNLLFPQFSGEWSRLSCFLAGLLAVYALARMLRTALRANIAFSASQRGLLFAVLLPAFTLGSPLVHLFACGQIYHESIVWGAAFGLAGIALLGEMLGSPARPAPLLLTAYSCAAAGALLSRATFGAPLYLILAVVIMPLYLARACTGRWLARCAAFGLLVLPAAAALAFQLWYNYARFKSPFSFYPITYWVQWHRTLAQVHPNQSMFGWDKLPDTIWNYLLRADGYFRGSAPFVVLADAETSRPGLYSPGELQPTLSLLVASPWLLLGAAGGAARLALRRGLAMQRFAAAGLAVQCLLILLFSAMTQRYILELLPCLAFMFVVLLSAVQLPQERSARLILFFALSAVVLFSIAVNVLSTLAWMSSAPAVPEAVRLGLLRVFTRVDSLLALP